MRAGRARRSETWRTYHLIGDAMRDSRRALGGLLGARRAAPGRGADGAGAAARRAPNRARWFALSAAAASFAAVALVGWVAFAPQPGVAPAPVAQVPGRRRRRSRSPCPLPSAANDYLLAHQGFSPRISFQGMAPYVRTVVRAPARGPRK